MKVKVKQAFRDKFKTTRIYQVGEVLDFDDERAERIVKLGLGEVEKEDEPEAVPEPPKPKKLRKKKPEE